MKTVLIIAMLAAVGPLGGCLRATLIVGTRNNVLMGAESRDQASPVQSGGSRFVPPEYAEKLDPSVP